MRDETISTMITVAKADPETTPEQLDAIRKACQRPIPRVEKITARQAQELLGVSRPTLRRYARCGTLHQINLSERRVRFSRVEVERLANGGLDAIRAAEVR